MELLCKLMLEHHNESKGKRYGYLHGCNEFNIIEEENPKIIGIFTYLSGGLLERTYKGSDKEFKLPVRFWESD